MIATIRAQANCIVEAIQDSQNTTNQDIAQIQLQLANLHTTLDSNNRLFTQGQYATHLMLKNHQLNFESIQRCMELNFAADVINNAKWASLATKEHQQTHQDIDLVSSSPGFELEKLKRQLAQLHQAVQDTHLDVAFYNKCLYDKIVHATNHLTAQLFEDTSSIRNKIVANNQAFHEHMDKDLTSHSCLIIKGFDKACRSLGQEFAVHSTNHLNMMSRVDVNAQEVTHRLENLHNCMDICISMFFCNLGVLML
jgi:hypothetical protein